MKNTKYSMSKNSWRLVLELIETVVSAVLTLFSNKEKKQ